MTNEKPNTSLPTEPPKFRRRVHTSVEKGEAIIIKKNDHIMWCVFCTECRKKIDEAVNGSMVEAAAKIHTQETGHTTIIGCMVVLMRK